MASLPITPPITEEEYLCMERAADFKSEYHGGEVFAMSGGSPNHSFIGAQFVFLLSRQTPRGCRVFTSDFRVRIPAGNSYVYPDCGLVCGDPNVSDADNLLNPALVVEVLSPSTESYDRGAKFALYRLVESLREYLVVHQNRRKVEYYSKQDDGSWVLREYEGAESSFTIVRFGITITLAELYQTALNLDQ
jgi:Uma2 family endonuclease